LQDSELFGFEMPQMPSNENELPPPPPPTPEQGGLQFDNQPQQTAEQRTATARNTAKLLVQIICIFTRIGCNLIDKQNQDQQRYEITKQENADLYEVYVLYLETVPSFLSPLILVLLTTFIIVGGKTATAFMNKSDNDKNKKATDKYNAEMQQAKETPVTSTDIINTIDDDKQRSKFKIDENGYYEFGTTGERIKLSDRKTKPHPQTANFILTNTDKSTEVKKFLNDLPNE
jgi:hypothetical protein